MYAKIKDGQVERYPYTLYDLGRDNPNTSLPPSLSQELLDHFGLVNVVVTGGPAIDHTKNIAEGVPQYVKERDRWEQTWIVTDAGDEEIKARTSARADELRRQRTAALSACDWTQLADAPGDAGAWATYRQALRDITEQPGFPWEVTWPQEP